MDLPFASSRITRTETSTSRMPDCASRPILHRAIKLPLGGPVGLPATPLSFCQTFFIGGQPARPANREHSITPETVMCPGNIKCSFLK